MKITTVIIVAVAALVAAARSVADDRPLKAVLGEPYPSGHQLSGSVMWHSDDDAVRADIEIPDAGLTVKFTVRPNDDKRLPASHTIEIVFMPPVPHGGITNVPGLLMKPDETIRGVPLNGVALKTADNAFLIGLSNVEVDRRRNVMLLNERTWIDIPIVYRDGGRVILAVEKGGLALAK
jgi:hypothetical protein